MICFPGYLPRASALGERPEAYDAEHRKAETEKIVIIILVFLLVAAASGIAMLIFKIKDMSDDAYFNQVGQFSLHCHKVLTNKARNVLTVITGIHLIPHLALAVGSSSRHRYHQAVSYGFDNIVFRIGWKYPEGQDHLHQQSGTGERRSYLVSDLC